MPAIDPKRSFPLTGITLDLPINRSCLTNLPAFDYSESKRIKHRGNEEVENCIYNCVSKICICHCPGSPFMNDIVS